jgi:hypothetical protein
MAVPVLQGKLSQANEKGRVATGSPARQQALTSVP